MTAFDIPPGEVQLWWASLDVSDTEVPHLRRILNQQELERADRFRVPHAARRFVAARAVLRTLLGQAMATDPDRIEFTYGDHGKPSVTGAPYFNASDSGDTVVVTMASQEIGVDVEGLRSLPNPDRLARRICTPDELEQLTKFPGDDFDARLLRLWTYKEAALKAVGLGLPGGLRNVEVDFRPGRPPRLVRLCDDSGGWSLLTADVNDSILCSIVVRGSVRRLGIRELPLQSV
jgi:4'-phosphopantetheinyl transferase